jgi:hypothetical protein
MRSKWLDWTPEGSSVGFEGPASAEYPITQASENSATQVSARSIDELIQKSVRREPTKPTEPVSFGNRKRLFERPSYFWGVNRNGKSRDYYGWRASVALEAICKIPAPKGLIVWLGEHSPFLYRNLTSDLPNRISQAWNDRVPFEDFDSLCFDLVDAYRRAAELYSIVHEKK